MAHPPDPNSSDTRARLIEAAAEAFFAGGYTASMEAIAARAGVAKQTLYNHFASKDALFAEVIRRDAERMVTALGDDGGDLRARLIRFSAAFRALVLGPRCIALYRTLIAESTRFPEMMQAFYDSGPAHTRNELAGLLESEMRAGRLCGDGPAAAQFAADILLGMLTGSERTRYLLGIEQGPPVNDQARAVCIVDSFLRAFAPEVSSDAAKNPHREHP